LLLNKIHWHFGVLITENIRRKMRLRSAQKKGRAQALRQRAALKRTANTRVRHGW
jgi:hypothetical protein